MTAKVKSQAKPDIVEKVDAPAPVASGLPKASKKSAVTKVEPVVPGTKSVKGEKPKKHKMVRDSFTMPHDDYVHISTIKERCLKAGIGVKKSEVLRAALATLAKLSDANLVKAMSQIEAIKTGRPAKT